MQILVLVFTAALWWIARRDLAARALPPSPESGPAPDTAELEQLCTTLETLVTRLARRLDAVEMHQAAAPPPVAVPKDEPVPIAKPEPAIRPRPAAKLRQARAPDPPPEPVPAVPEPILPPAMPEAAPLSEADRRHGALEALLDAGVTDPTEIARQTGLGRGEVDLILSLRQRQL